MYFKHTFRHKHYAYKPLLDYGKKHTELLIMNLKFAF